MMDGSNLHGSTSKQGPSQTQYPLHVYSGLNMAFDFSRERKAGAHYIGNGACLVLGYSLLLQSSPCPRSFANWHAVEASSKYHADPSHTTFLHNVPILDRPLRITSPSSTVRDMDP